MKLIFHIDVNSAFLSWTACGLLEEGGADTLPTDIREIASVIGGSEKSRHRAGEEHTCQTIWDRHR